MRTLAARVLLALLAASPLLAQATSQWRTPRALPVAVVEVPGGDVEVLVAALPDDAAPPSEVAGFPTTLDPQRGVLLWAARVPLVLVQPAVTEFARALAGSGSAAVVLLGPLPLRELRDALHVLDDVPLRAAPHLPCVLAEGGVEVLRGTPEGVDLALALPGPQDPRFDLLPALAAFLRVRLRAAFPDIEVDTELAGGCARLHLRVAASAAGARPALERLRRQLARLPADPPTAEEAARASAAGEAQAARSAVAGRAVAEDLAGRLAFGGRASAALAAPLVDAGTLAALVRQLLEGHAGFATVVEQERRPREEPPVTLDDGAMLSVRWTPSETGVVAIALGGMDPRSGHAILVAAAERVARLGWSADVRDLLGVPTLAAAAPGTAVVATMEQASDALSAPQQPAPDDLAAEVARAEGLAEHVSAESVSVALALPPEVDEGPEAGRKFFGGLQSQGVRSGSPRPGPGLTWTVREGDPEVIGTVELPPTAAGMVAGELVRARLAGEPDVHASFLAPPGRIVLAVAARGGAHVPAVDDRLADAWGAARRPGTAAELTAARHRLFAVLFGDAAQATARAAASAFLPPMPSATGVLSVDAAEVNAALKGLPGWAQLPRFARGRAPEVAAPPPRRRGVRKSPARG